MDFGRILFGFFPVFGKDFEETFRPSFSNYTHLESRAKEKIGDSKPLVARYIAERLQMNDDIGWARFEELKKKIEHIEYVDVIHSESRDIVDRELPF